MPLRGRTIVDLREEIAVHALSGRYTVQEVAEMFGVTTPTVRLWRERYRQLGRQGLVNRSHAPYTVPHKTSDEIEQLIVSERKLWGFGSKKILVRLAEQYPDLALPKRSTIDAILARHHLVDHRPKRRPKGQTPFLRRYEATFAGELMTADFKGQFRLGNGRYCYPLTLVDSFSRYLLACEALSRPTFEATWPIIERVFRERGLPRAMQSDNGAPFGPTHGRYSRMSVELMKLDVQPVFSRPGRPDDNGRHERMHRDLKDRTTRPPARSVDKQQAEFDSFRRLYNEERPHEGIDMRRPARVYVHAELRPFPRRRVPAEYPRHFEHRKVSVNGMFSWKNRQVFLSEAFAGEQIALEPTDDGIWTVHYFRFVLAKFNEKDSDCV
jgi:putative transposase